MHALVVHRSLRVHSDRSHRHSAVKKVIPRFHGPTAAAHAARIIKWSPPINVGRLCGKSPRNRFFRAALPTLMGGLHLMICAVQAATERQGAPMRFRDKLFSRGRAKPFLILASVNSSHLKNRAHLTNTPSFPSPKIANRGY